MQPQGSGLIDQDYFNNLINEINGIQGTGACAELQKLVTQAYASMGSGNSGISSEIAKLEAFLTIPSSLGGVITWITNFVAPMQSATNNYIAQLTATEAQIAQISAAVAAAAGRLTSCSISIPSI